MTEAQLDVSKVLARAGGPRWFFETVGSQREVSADEIHLHFNAAFVEAVGVENPVEWVGRMSAQCEVADPVTVLDDGSLRVPLRPRGSIPRWRVILAVDADGRIAGFDFGNLEVEGVDFEAISTGDLLGASDQLRDVHRIFDLAYRDADHAYLDESLFQLDLVCLGRATDTDEVVGFALGGWRKLDIPRRPAQVVKLAGLACIDPSFRRRGLASRLGELAIAGGDMAAEDCLFGGRMAHPASYRQTSARLGTVPRPDRSPNAWQREVGAIVADLFGVTEFDPETFVCRGRSRSIGEPVIDIDVRPDEWTVFAPVDRAKGETLLGIWWGGDPGPPGWVDAD